MSCAPEDLPKQQSHMDFISMLSMPMISIHTWTKPVEVRLWSDSGAASASLMLSHWERLQIDPFFMPVTEEEREEFGEEGQGVGTANLARTMIDEVRRRKGLPTDKKVVEVSTKQRTRARKV